MTRRFQAPSTIESAPYVVRASRAEKKAEEQKLRDIVEALAALTIGQFEMIDLPEDLRRSLTLARRLPRGDAKRRQIQFSRGILLDVDAERIQADLAKIDLKR